MSIHRCDNLPGYRWLLLGSSTLVFVGFYGTELSFGVFLMPFINEFGWSRTVVSGAMSLLMGLSGPLGTLTGGISDRYGARAVVTVSAFFSIVGYVLLSRLDALWELYLYFGIFQSICIAGCWSPLIGAVSRWFDQKRVLAIGILTSGLTIGSMLIPPMTAQMIAWWGWRYTFFSLAIIVALTTVPALVVLRENSQKGSIAPPPLSEKPTPLPEFSAAEAVKTLPFALIVIIGFVMSSGFFFLAVHLVAFASDMGISPIGAALVFSFLSIGNIGGKLSAWILNKKLGSRDALMLFVGVMAFAAMALTHTRGLGILFTLGALFGFGLGGAMTIRMSIIPIIFGTKAVGMLVGLVGIAWGAGGIFGPIFAGFVFDKTQSYDISFYVATGMLIIGVIASAGLNIPERKDAVP